MLRQNWVPDLLKQALDLTGPGVAVCHLPPLMATDQELSLWPADQLFGRLLEYEARLLPRWLDDAESLIREIKEREIGEAGSTDQDLAWT